MRRHFFHLAKPFLLLLPALLVLALTRDTVAQTAAAPAPTPATAVPPAAAPAATVPPPAGGTAKPAVETKPCFVCNGAGKGKCPVSSCVAGQRDCPGPCLKLSTPGWQHLDIAGHGPEELWMKFPDLQGNGYYSWTQKHIGQVVKRQNDAIGKASIVEICPVCKGTAHVKCTTCDGTGISVCAMCTGSGVVPKTWTAFDNPKMKNRPDRFKLKDGTEIFGRKVIESTDSITVRTEKGSVDINKADLATE